MSRSRRGLAIAFLPLGLLVAAGCSDDDGTESSAAADDGGTDNGSETEAPVMSVVTPPGSAKDDFEGAQDDVADLTCEFAKRGWDVTGSLTNPTDGSADYRIYVAFSEGTTTHGLLQIDVERVGAGKSADFDGRLDLPRADLACTSRVERVSR